MRATYFNRPSPTPFRPDSYSPAAQLEAFLKNVGSALDHVTFLDVHCEDTGSNFDTAISFTASLHKLICACPSLLKFCCPEGPLSTPLWKTLSQQCPFLRTLNLSAKCELDTPHIRDFLHVQASLFPLLHTLILRGRDSLACSLPDMCNNTSILILKLPEYNFEKEEDWLRLPQNLLHFHPESFNCGPPSTKADGSHTLASLLSLTLGNQTWVPLHGLAQILQAAPALQALTSEGCDATREDHSVVVEVELGSTSASDFGVLQGRREILLLTTMHVCFSFMDYEDWTALPPLIASLPIVKGVTCLQINNCMPSHVRSFLEIFPDLKRLCLNIDTLDDVDLCAVAVCKKLISLSIFCGRVTPVGIFEICMLIPTVCLVGCIFEITRSLNASAIEECERLLQAHGRLVTFR